VRPSANTTNALLIPVQIDVSSILTTLAQSARPLRPRTSDGSNAHIVQQAEKLRRGSGSPASDGLQVGLLPPVIRE
jgi:hypothetical protein